MSIQKAVEFIKSSGKEDIKGKLKGIQTSDKNKAIATIVNIGHDSGFDFTAGEYEQAAQEVVLILNQEHKSIEDLRASKHDLNGNGCSGCAACATCTLCLACLTCAWCVVIPIAGAAAIAADAMGIISAAATLSTSVATSVAASVQ